MNLLRRSYLFPSRILCYFILGYSPNVYSQNIANYVNNPGFETLLLTATVNPYDAAKYWGPLDSSLSGSHLIRSKSLGTVPIGFGGFQWPRTGNNFIVSQFYCDINTCSDEQRWYPRNRLKQTLKSNTTYCAKYYLLNTNNCVLGINSFGVFFGGGWMDTTKYCDIPITYLNPQVDYQGPIITDTLNWIAISGTFTADGSEKYMLLGNFKSNVATQTLLINPAFLPSRSADVIIDDVSLIEMELPAYAGPDKWFLPGDSVYIGRQSDVEIDESCIWYQMTSPTTSVTIDTIAGLYVKPVSTTTFVVRQQLWCSGVKWDTVVVSLSGVGLNELETQKSNISLFPNPVSELIQVHYSFDFPDPFTRVSFYNNLGQLIREEDVIFKNKHATLSISSLENGFYYLELKNSNGLTLKRSFTVSK